MEKKIPPYVLKTSGSTKLNPQLLNIDGSEDPFYRYKMRQLFVQVVGKGKMIKTVLLNVDEVAKDLKVAPAYMTAYLGYEIGAGSKYDPKKPDRERASISGDRDATDLSTMMKKFISEIILCSNCKLPETTMAIDKKTREVTTSCRSCGHKEVLNLKPKFQAYILNHPAYMPNISKEERAVKKKQDEAAQEVEENGELLPEGEEPSPKQKPEKVVAKPRKQKKVVEEDDDEDDGVEWSCDTSSEAVKARRREMLPDNVRNILDKAEAKEDAFNELKQFVSNNPSGNIAEEVKRLQEKFQIPNSRRAHLLFDVLFKPNVVPDIAPHKQTLQDLIYSDAASQNGALECIEKLCSSKELSKKAPLIVKQFYDSDIIEEEVILDWYENRLSNPDLKKELKKLVTWLQEAEEEDEE
jgi:translation initiation factor 5